MISFMISAVPPKIDRTKRPLELTIASEIIGLGRVRGGHGRVRASRGLRGCDLGGDHAPGDGLAAWQLPGPGHGRDDDTEPAAADVPAVDPDVDSGELIAALLPQPLLVRDRGHGSQVGRAPASRPAAISTSAGSGRWTWRSVERCMDRSTWPLGRDLHIFGFARSRRSTS